MGSCSPASTVCLAAAATPRDITAVRQTARLRGTRTPALRPPPPPTWSPLLLFQAFPILRQEIFPVLVPNSPRVSLCRFNDLIHAEFILVRAIQSLCKEQQLIQITLYTSLPSATAGNATAVTYEFLDMPDSAPGFPLWFPQILLLDQHIHFWGER